MNFRKMIIFVVFLTMPIVYFNIFANDLTTDIKILKTISCQESYKLIIDNKDNKNFIIIDVRTPFEFKDSHIEKATNIDYYGKDFKDNLNKLDKSQKYLIYCRTGHRSGLALDIMKDFGFKEVYNMAGGMSQWLSSKYPVKK